MYDGHLSLPVIPQLLDAGLIFLLRFCLDDNAVPIVSATSQAIAELIAPPSDEVCLFVAAKLSKLVAENSHIFCCCGVDVLHKFLAATSLICHYSYNSVTLKQMCNIGQILYFSTDYSNIIDIIR